MGRFDRAKKKKSLGVGTYPSLLLIMIKPKAELHAKMIEKGYRDSFPGREKVEQVATVWANTRIDWIFLSSDFPG